MNHQPIIDKILSLDLATKTGWAISQGGVIVQSGTENFKSKSIQSQGAILKRLYNWLNFLKEEYKLSMDSMVYFEEPFSGKNPKTDKFLFGLLGVTLYWCEKNIIDYDGFFPTELKGYCGKKKKEDIIKWVQEKGYKPEDDNEADAIVINLMAIELNRYTLGV